MNEAPDFLELFADFPELASEDIVYSQEVLAHFGLVFSAFANLEAGLQCCYTLSKCTTELQAGNIKSEEEWTLLHDQFEEKAFKATYGQLLGYLSEFSPLDNVRDKLEELKEKRNYFAHHFFREENGKLFNDEATLHLLSRMHKLRKEISKANEAVNTVHMSLFRSLYPSTDVDVALSMEIKKTQENFENNPPFDSRF